MPLEMYKIMHIIYLAVWVLENTLHYSLPLVPLPVSKSRGQWSQWGVCYLSQQKQTIWKLTTGCQDMA